MIQLDLMSRTPVYEQIIEQMEQFIMKGILKGGDQMPSVRSMSVQLSINPNTIQKAYSELERKGLTCSVPGRGSFVSEAALDLLKTMKRDELDDLKALLENLALARISKEEILACVNEVYDKD